MKKFAMLLPLAASFGGCFAFVAIHAQDAVTADPKHYSVVAENDQIRILRIKYGPNETSVMHYHPAGAAVYLTEATGTFTLPDGSVVPANGKKGMAVLAPAGAHKPHIDGNGFEGIQIELKTPPSDRFSVTGPEIDVTRQLLKDYEAGNWSQWQSHYSDTARAYHNSPAGVTPAVMQENLKKALTKIASYHFADKDRFFERVRNDEGETWVYFWGMWEGKVAATGKTIVTPVHLALKFDGHNKIVREYGFYDMSQLMSL